VLSAEFVKVLVVELIKEQNFRAGAGQLREFPFLCLTGSAIFSNQPADSQTTGASLWWSLSVRTFFVRGMSKVVC
jgi:hypothetical protein